tara:strand:+ start:83 stop:289 length:207 start_codon:yes stop_codon:yes gene_type:complete
VCECHNHLRHRRDGIIGTQVTLGVVFVGLPWAYYASQDAIKVRAGTHKKKEELQRTVYEKRLDRRREE